VEEFEQGLPLLHQADQGHSGRHRQRRGDIAAQEGQLAQIQTELDAARQRIPVLKHEQTAAQRKLKELEARLFFAPKLPAWVLLSWTVQRWGYAARRR